MINAPTAKPVDVLNILASITNPFVVTPFLFSMILIIYMPITQKTKVIAILSIKGISNTPALFAFEKPTGARNERSATAGRNYQTR